MMAAQEALFTLDGLQHLVASFQKGMYNVHVAWHYHMLTTVTKLWSLACDNTQSQRAMINFAGFLLLPGLLMSLRTLDKQLKPVDFLRQLAASDNPGLALVQKAEDLLASRTPGPPRGEFVQPTFAQMEARAAARQL